MDKKVDTVIEAIRNDLLQRSEKGITKYGVTLDRNDLLLKHWLQHAYEECLDQANYLKRCIIEIEKEEAEQVVLKAQKTKEAQGWEDFREGAYNAWKKKEEAREEQQKILDKMVEDNQNNGLY